MERLCPLCTGSVGLGDTQVLRHKTWLEASGLLTQGLAGRGLFVFALGSFEDPCVY